MRTRISIPVALLALAACHNAPSQSTIASASGSSTTASTPATSSSAPAPSTSASAPTTPAPASHPIALPGGPPVSMDYLAFDLGAGKLWVPAGNTGKVDVIDGTSEAVTSVEGFTVKEVERNGKKRTVGPSSASVGDGFVYVGNRGDSSICAVDTSAMKIAGCITLTGSPDGVSYVKSAKEVWVTTPHDNAMVVLDVSTPSTPKMKTSIAIDGGIEGYAVDDAHGVFYTNLEDKNATLAIDIASHKVTQTYKTACDDKGPRGLAIDTDKRWLFVACTNRLAVVDAGNGGAPLDAMDLGGGIDNIDYVPSTHTVYVASGQAATVTFVKAGDQGKLASLGSAPTGDGARVVVAGTNGNAYVADSKQGRIVVAPPPK